LVRYAFCYPLFLDSFVDDPRENVVGFVTYMETKLCGRVRLSFAQLERFECSSGFVSKKTSYQE